MSIKRWFAEARNPALKCARIGHAMRDREYRAYIYPPASRWAVADRAWLKQSSCARCNYAEPEHEISRTGLDGLTMDAEKWDRLMRDGRLPI